MFSVPLLGSVRLVVYIMMVVVIGLHYAMRYAISISIVCMVVPPNRGTNISITGGNVSLDQQMRNITNPACQSNSKGVVDYGYEVSI